jgi:hypothetical protein
MNMIKYLFTISILLCGMEILFSQDLIKETDSISKVETRSFFPQDIYVNYGNIRVNTDTLGLNQVSLLQNSFPIAANIDTFNRESVVYASTYRTSNLSLGTSFIINPKKFDSRVTFRWDGQFNYRTGSHYVFNAAHSDTLLSTTGTNANSLDFQIDSIRSSYVGIIDNYDNYSIGSNFMINLKYFTTLDIYAGVGGSYGFGQHQYEMFQTSINEVHQVLDETWSITNIIQNESFQSNTELARFQSYSYYIPCGVNWQTAHYSNMFKHLIVSFDLRYGFRGIKSNDMNLSKQSFRYIGLGLKWRI